MNQTTTKTRLAFDQIGMVFPDGTEALRNVSFSVDKGEFVTVVGPSGCGKSTLLKIASGLLDSTSGHVSVDRVALGPKLEDAILDILEEAFDALPKAQRKSDEHVAEMLRRAVRRECAARWGKKPVTEVMVQRV